MLHVTTNKINIENTGCFGGGGWGVVLPSKCSQLNCHRENIIIELNSGELFKKTFLFLFKDVVEGSLFLGGSLK